MEFSFLVELGTGVGVSVLSKEIYTSHFKDIFLLPSDTCLHTYTGHPVKVSGQLSVHLKYQEQSAYIPLLAVKDSGPSLFGRDWLKHVRLDWKDIRSIHVSDKALPLDVKSQLKAAIQSYPNVFKSGLETIKRITSKLEMKPHA